jgi:hypothetical protein
MNPIIILNVNSNSMTANWMRNLGHMLLKYERNDHFHVILRYAISDELLREQDPPQDKNQERAAHLMARRLYYWYIAVPHRLDAGVEFEVLPAPPPDKCTTRDLSTRELSQDLSALAEKRGKAMLHWFKDEIKQCLNAVESAQWRKKLELETIQEQSEKWFEQECAKSRA